MSHAFSLRGQHHGAGEGRSPNVACIELPPAPADDEDEEDAGKGGEEGGEEEEAAGEAGKKSRPSSRGGPWKWRTELHALVKLMGSRQKVRARGSQGVVSTPEDYSQHSRK